MANPLTMKLEQFTSFDPEERQRLDQLLSYPTETYARGKTIIREGEKVDDIHLVLTGLAARSKTLRNGDRQFMAFLVPGDLCDVEVFILEGMDHDITALTDTTCVLIPAKIIEGLLTESTKLTRALWWGTMSDSAILREWIVDHGSRDSFERIAHLMCEMLIRYRVIGETTDNSFPFLLTQEELADATGMTPVHVNRMLQQLRSDGLIELTGKVLTVLDPKGLQRAAKYDSTYLHLIRTERRDPEVSQRAGDLVSASPRGLLHDVAGKVKSVFGRSDA
ncbi:MAG TPA: Crp/Fnr family transcriptional regulator [Allosphingosinicella sp.]|uniref:Crp/Fnr family transcriptional regulator n=1 Tax=Allosphingosinicella sp. TaxID=2823234 RepID=UPI002F284021